MTATATAPVSRRYTLHRRRPSLPLVGDLLHMRADHLAHLDACARTGADVVELDLGWRAGFVLLDPDAVRDVLVDDNDAFVRAGNLETRAISEFFGRGVLTTDGGDWLAYKRMNAPAFTRGAVEAMQSLVDDSLDRSFAAWLPSPARATRPLFDDFLALAVTATTTGFLSLRPDDEEQAALCDAMREGPELIFAMARNLAPWLRHVPTPHHRRVQRAVAAVERLIRRNVERRRAEPSRAPADLLDMVLQYRNPKTGAQLGPVEVRDQLFTAIIAAPENIATTLAWASHALHSHPAVLGELRRSLARGETHYLRAVVDETMRRHAATPMLDRVAARDVQLGGVHIPRGSLVVVPILALHNHPRYWDAPAEFRPQRWIGAPAPRAFFPFGHGPRKCVGERLGRAVIESALRRFVTTFDWSRPTAREPGVTALVNLRPRDRMQMTLSRRAPRRLDIDDADCINDIDVRAYRDIAAPQTAKARSRCAATE